MDISSFEAHYSSNKKGKTYSKRIGDWEIIVYVGVWISSISNPVDAELDINDYTSISVEVSDKFGFLILSERIKNLLASNKIESNPFLDNKLYCTNNNVTPSQVELMYNVLVQLLDPKSTLEKKQEDKVGGKCSVCNGYDKWASWSNGKCFCYMHIPGY